MAFALLYGGGIYKGEVGGTIAPQGALDKCYWFALEAGQGKSWAEFTSSPFPPAGINGVVAFDTQNQEHELIFDDATGTYFDVSLRDGPSGSDLSRGFKELAAFPTTEDEGNSIPCEIDDAEYTLSGEYNQLEYQMFLLAMRPDDDDDEYLTGLQIDFSLYNGETKLISSIASQVDRTSEITVSPKTVSGRIQPRIAITESGWRVLCFSHSMLLKMMGMSPGVNITRERSYQKIFNAPDLWIIGSKDYLNDRAFGGVMSVIGSGTIARVNNSAAKLQALKFISTQLSKSMTVAAKSEFSFMTDIYVESSTATILDTASSAIKIVVTPAASPTIAVNYGGSTYTITLSSALTVSTWYRIVVVADGSLISIYKNGLLAGSVAASASISFSEAVYIGAASGETVRLYDSRLFIDLAMTADQASWYYNECVIRQGKAAVPIA